MPTRFKKKSTIKSPVKYTKSVTVKKEINNLVSLFCETNTSPDVNKFHSTLITIIEKTIKLVSASSGFIIRLDNDRLNDEILFLDSSGNNHNFTCYHHNIDALTRKRTPKSKIINFDKNTGNLLMNIMPASCKKIFNAKLIPLFSDNKIISYLGVCNKFKGFSKSDNHLLINIAGIISLVIENDLALELRQQSKQKYSDLIDSLHQGILILDTEAKVVFASKGICEILGYPQSEILNKDLFAFMDRYEIKRFKNILRRKKINLANTNYLTLKHKSGIELNVSLNMAPIYDEEGLYLGLIANIQNLSDRGVAKIVLAESEKKFRELANLMPLIVFETDRKGKFVFINSLLTDILGYKTKNAKKIDLFQLIIKKYRAKLKSIMKRNRTIDNGTNNYFTALREDSTELPVMLNMATIMKNDRVSGWRGVIIDITERKQNEARRMELEQKAVVASHMASIGELASGIAHEVNNPLASIVLYSQLLIEEDLPDSIKRDVMSIYESAVRATNIIRRLLTFARQQLQKRIPVNINDIVEVTLELRKYALETSNISVKTFLDPQLPFTMADAVQLQEVFLNIILNAEIEMKLSHGKGNLQIKTEKYESNIRISFKDDGPGIAKENLGKIFNPFFTTRQVGEGTGLGLSICHGIIIEHGGHIYAESEPGNGATFYIELPVIERVPVHAQRDMNIFKKRKLPKSKILIIDDEIGILDSLSRILAKQGYEVETTDNCEEALQIIRNKKYDFILLDVKLPGMSGIELFKELQNKDESVTKKLAIITGDTMEPATQEFLEYARVPCFVKPFDTKNFIREINSLIHESQQ